MIGIKSRAINSSHRCPDPKSQFNRRARRLEGLLEELRRFWVQQMGYHFERTLVMDTKPIPVVGYKRSKIQSDFVGSAS